MIRVGFTGAPGSGKTSTARALVAELRKNPELNNVELVSEYARRYINKHGSIDEMWEQYRITSKQIEWEDSYSTDKIQVLVTDSPIFLGFMYATELPRRNQKDIMVLNDMFKMLTKINFPKPRYGIIFHLPPVLKAVDDGTRKAEHLDQSWRERANQAILHSFKIFPPERFVEINEVEMSDRVALAMHKIKGYLINEKNRE